MIGKRFIPSFRPRRLRFYDFETRDICVVLKTVVCP